MEKFPHGFLLTMDMNLMNQKLRLLALHYENESLGKQRHQNSQLYVFVFHQSREKNIEIFSRF